MNELTKLAKANEKRPLPYREESALTDVINATQKLNEIEAVRLLRYLMDTSTGRKHVREGDLDLLASYWPKVVAKLKEQLAIYAKQGGK